MKWRIGEILIRKKLIDWSHLEAGLTEQQETKEYLGEILIRQRAVPGLLFYRALAEQFHMPYVDLKHTRINPNALGRIPRSLAQKYQMMPVEMVNDTLFLAVGDPARPWPKKEIQKLANIPRIERVLSLPSDIQDCIQEYYSPKK